MIAGGLWKSVDEAVELGAKSFAIFLKGQRQWVSKPLKMEDAEKFKKACKVFAKLFDQIYISLERIAE